MARLLVALALIPSSLVAARDDREMGSAYFKPRVDPFGRSVYILPTGVTSQMVPLEAQVVPKSKSPAMPLAAGVISLASAGGAALLLNCNRASPSSGASECNKADLGSTHRTPMFMGFASGSTHKTPMLMVFASGALVGLVAAITGILGAHRHGAKVVQAKSVPLHRIYTADSDLPLSDEFLEMESVPLHRIYTAHSDLPDLEEANLILPQIREEPGTQSATPRNAGMQDSSSEAARARMSGSERGCPGMPRDALPSQLFGVSKWSPVPSPASSHRELLRNDVPSLLPLKFAPKNVKSTPRSVWSATPRDKRPPSSIPRTEEDGWYTRTASPWYYNEDKLAMASQGSRRRA